MRCVILASLSTAFMQSEVQELVNSLTRAKYTVRLMQSNITSLELYRMTHEGSVDLVWVCAHSSKEGFVFGEVVISPRELGLWLHQMEVGDLVLNTCFSIQHISEIQRHANVNVVATIEEEIHDNTAWTNALYLGQKLAESSSLQAAYRDTLAESESKYRWFPAPRIKEGRMAERGNELEELQRTVERLEHTVARLVRALQGDNLIESDGLIKMVRNLESRVKVLERKVDGSKLVLTNWGAIIIILGFVGLLLGFIYMTVKLGGGGGPVAFIQLNLIPIGLSLSITGGH